MAKDGNHSKIPRLDGVTRIPLPGTIRAPHSSNAANRTQFSQMLRPSSFSGLRPPVMAMASLKKSLSGERFSEAASLVGKRTTTAVKKFLTKPEKSSTQLETQVRKMSATSMSRKVDNSVTVGHQTTKESTLTRSETFVREGSELEIFRLTHHVLKQSTPMPSMSKAGEKTHLLSSNGSLHTTHTIDGSRLQPLFGRAVTLDSPKTFNIDHMNSVVGASGFGNTITMDTPVSLKVLPNLGNTMTLDNMPKNEINNETRTLGVAPNNNLTINKDAPSFAGLCNLGNTMTLDETRDNGVNNRTRTLGVVPNKNLTINKDAPSFAGVCNLGNTMTLDETRENGVNNGTRTLGVVPNKNLTINKDAPSFAGLCNLGNTMTLDETRGDGVNNGTRTLGVMPNNNLTINKDASSFAGLCNLGNTMTLDETRGDGVNNGTRTLGVVPNKNLTINKDAPRFAGLCNLGNTMTLDETRGDGVNNGTRTLGVVPNKNLTINKDAPSFAGLCNLGNTMTLDETRGDGVNNGTRTLGVMPNNNLTINKDASSFAGLCNLGNTMTLDETRGDGVNNGTRTLGVVPNKNLTINKDAPRFAGLCNLGNTMTLDETRDDGVNNGTRTLGVVPNNNLTINKDAPSFAGVCNLGNTMTLDETRNNGVSNGTRTLGVVPSKNLTINKDASSFAGLCNLGNTMTLDETRGDGVNNGTRTLGVVPNKNFTVNKDSQTFAGLCNTLTLDKTRDIINHGTQTLSGVAPIGNAILTNVNSSENFSLLDDVKMPSFDGESTLIPKKVDLAGSCKSLIDLTDDLEDTLSALPPDKDGMKLQLHSTMNNERLLDITEANVVSPGHHLLMMNITRDLLGSPRLELNKNNTNLLYMTMTSSNLSPRQAWVGDTIVDPMIQKEANSDLALLAQTPDEPMDIDGTLKRTEDLYDQTMAMAATPFHELKQKARFSLGLDLTESTLDCSIELCDISLSSTVHSSAMPTTGLQSSSAAASVTQSPSQHQLKKQNSFEMDESLGILTPDQMKEFLDSTTTTTNLDLPLALHPAKMSFHQMRIDQTPSPEDLPLDPVEVKTDISDTIMIAQHQHPFNHQQQTTTTGNGQQRQLSSTYTEISQTDTDVSKADPMTKSSVSKISTSFITSVTSVTSLDTGYQGDGEMSRPASRGAGDHSPSNGPTRKPPVHVSRQPSFHQQHQHQHNAGNIPIRRQDPMTDSDFFTESDADDIFHRGDRRAQVIDGHLYGPMLLPTTASVFITEQPQMEDSCMESSGIFTDVENRCDDDLAQTRRNEQDIDMSPDGDSTDTVKSNKNHHDCTKQDNVLTITATNVIESGGGERSDQPPPQPQTVAHGQGQWNPANTNGMLSDSQASSTIHSSISSDRISMTTDYNPTATSASNRTSYCGEVGVGSGMAEDYKSFSLEALSAENRHTAAADTTTKAFFTVTEAVAAIGKLLPPSNTAPTHTAAAVSVSVKKVNTPRKHSSLSSLSTLGGKYENNQSHRSTPAFNNTTANSKSNLSGISSCSLQQQQLSTPGNGDAAAPKKSPLAKKSSIGLGATNGTSPDMVLHHRPLSKRNLDQENKNPAISSLTSVLTSPSSSLSSPPRFNGAASCGNSPTLRKVLPNKWDAVMNKIASNKLHMKKNYSEVKSKVSTGVVHVRRSPSCSNASAGGSANNLSVCVAVGASSQAATATGVNDKVVGSAATATLPQDTGSSNCSSGLRSPQTKRIIQGAAKRGRSYSKDSQQSSQSDLSLSSGSPKLLAKTPLRAAKKRDVRNLSISPTDLGPPPKTQQTANGQSARPKPSPTATANLTQKRLSANASNHAAPQQITNTSTLAPTSTNTSTSTNTAPKGSPPAKKITIFTPRRSESKTTLGKTPLKDHNRLISQQQHETTIAKTNGTLITNTGNNSSKSKSTAASQPAIVTSTPHSSSVANNHQFHGISSIEKVATQLRANSQTPPTPTLNYKNKNNAQSILDGGKKSQQQHHQQLKQQQRKLQQKQLQHPGSKEEDDVVDEEKTLTNNVIAADSTEDELQRDSQLKLLNRHSCNGRLDFHSIHQKLLEAEEAQKSKGVEALGVLLQYLVYDLNAFSCPSLKVEYANAKKNLSKTLLLLDQAKSSCQELQDQIFDKESYYQTREEELQALHRCELEKAQSSLQEFQTQAKEHITNLENQLAAKDAEHKRNLDCYRSELDVKMVQKSAELQAARQRESELVERVSALTKSEMELREKVLASEDNWAQRIQASAERERELVEKLNTVNKELESLRYTKESREQELKDKLNLSKDEISVLRLSKSFNESSSSPSSSLSSSATLSGVPHSSPRNSSGANAASLEIQRLQSEAESLRCVLEIKQKEISKLTKQNQELIRDADESMALVGKVSTLESSYEMLQTEISLKSEKEKELREKYDELKKAYNHEAHLRKRLSFDNEALQWQLKQRSEQLHIVEAKFHEHAILSASKGNIYENSSTHELNSFNSSLASLNRTNCSDRIQFQMDDVSPPASPIIKGVIEKNDSVSWVLEMDDETPEVAASKIVKRAGSFRSVERSPSTRRQLSMSMSCTGATTNGASSSSGAAPTTNRPNPLSQSMSATSVIRQHSNDAAEFLGRVHSRIRSKSVSVKSPEHTAQQPASGNKKIMRQNSAGNSRKHEITAPSWKEPICSSSPYMRSGGMRCRSAASSSSSANVKSKSASALLVPSCSSSSSSSVNKSDNIEGNYSRPTSTMKTRHLITCDTSTLNTGEKLEMRSLPSHPSVHDLKVIKKCQEIQESAGEAMVSGTNSEDEGCSASSDEAVSSSSTTSSSSSTSLNHHHSHHHHHHHHHQRLSDHQMSIEEVLLLDKIHSLNGTPMEVSWSDDPDQFASESTV